MRAEAQSTGGFPPRPTLSCGPVALILLSVRDQHGAPVSGAKVRVVRRSDGRVIQDEAPESVPAGEYQLMDDLALRLVSARGTMLDVSVRHGRSVATTVIRVGRTADGCHVRRIGRPRTVTIPNR
jgi:hypothetical protein